jgi:uncharacterized coiled-coil DUF342 family protein
MDWVSIVSIIATFIVSGGLGTLLTLKYKKSSAKSSAESSHMEVVQKIIDEYQDLFNGLKESYEKREALLNERIDLLEKKIDQQQLQIKENNEIITKLQDSQKKYQKLVTVLEGKVTHLRGLTTDSCQTCSFAENCKKKDYVDTNLMCNIRI